MTVDTYQRDASADRWSAPPPPAGHIERCRLDHHYAGATGRLLRLLAPPGYGKSSIVARWAASDPRCVRWIDLGRGHDDPVALFGTLQEALAGIVEIPTPTAAHGAAPNPYVQALAEALVTSAPTAPFVLVLDDVHRIRSAAGNWLIRTVAEHVTPDSTLVLMGRGHHDGGAIGALRLVPGVVDIGVDHLAFDDSESHRLLEMLGVDDQTPEVAEVVRLLEGWPAGVRLAGEVLRSSAPPHHVADHVSLVDYLRGEWVGQLGEDDRSFLREVACLEQFTGEMCDAVLARSGSIETLQRLHRDQVVVFALDQRDERYRLHGLLNRWLSTELRHLDPQRWTRIHLDAARYCERRGDVDRAVEHALAAEDLSTVEALAMIHGGTYFTNGFGATVERWLGTFPPEHARQSAGLSALHSIEALHAGDEMRAVQWLRVLDEALAGRPHPPEDPTVWWADVLHAALDERPARDLLPTVAAARRHLAGGPWAGFACWVHGALSFIEGEIDAARDALQAGIFEAELLRTPLLVGHCLATLSVIDDCVGDDVAATSCATRARAAIASCGGEVLPPTAPATAVMALWYARRGDRDAAGTSIAAARRALTGFRSVAPWFNVVARLSLVRAALLLDDRETARDVMRELEHHARFEPTPSDPGGRGAIDCGRALRQQVDAMHVPSTGASALTDAEVRVLHLLPTNLSLADIAIRLFLSRNTVKSHVASIYRKLGASKRSEAVEQARSVGLLRDAPAP